MKRWGTKPYGGGTFRVRGFVFKNPNSQEIYKTAREMWDKKINWNKIKSQFSTRGSSEDAAIIERGLNALSRWQYKKTRKAFAATDEEAARVQDLIDAAKGESSFYFDRLLRFRGLKKSQKGSAAGTLGNALEERIAIIFSHLFESPSGDMISDFQTGKQQVYSPIHIYHKIDINSINKKKEQPTSQELIQAIKEHLGTDYKEIVKSCVATLQKEVTTGEDIIAIRQATVSGKADLDLDVPYSLTVDSTLPEFLQKMGEAVKGRTFSLKNYTGKTLSSWKGVSIGYAEDLRAYSSFYYAASGDDYFPNVATFIYSSKKSKDADVVRFLSWSRFLYELTGFGQLRDIFDRTGKVVDYLIINQADVLSNLRVIWVYDLIKNMPNGNPSASQQEVQVYRHQAEEMINVKEYILPT